MRYYFAGAYARRTELAVYADEIQSAIGTAKVVSTWLTTDLGIPDEGFSVGQLTTPEAVKQAWTFGKRDVADLWKADVIVSFTGSGERGGRHVEFGIALDLVTSDGWDGSSDVPRLVVIGPREHVFHCHPATEVYVDWRMFLQHEVSNPREDDE